MITRARMILGAQVKPEEIYSVECSCSCGKSMSSNRPPSIKCAVCGHVISFEVFWKDPVVAYLRTLGHEAFRNSFHLGKELPFFSIQSIRCIDDLEDPPMAVGLVVSDISDKSEGRRPSEIALSQIKYMKHRVLMIMEDLKLGPRPLGIFLVTDAVKVKSPSAKTRQIEATT